MKEQLIKYVDLLFAGAPDAQEIKQEILQNTLDRYDDLIAQGKSPEAAYSLSISGIGDVSELLGRDSASHTAVPGRQPTPEERPLWKKLLRACSIFLYIISFIPLFILDELGMGTIGFCGTLSIIAVATAMMILSASSKREKKEASSRTDEMPTPRQELNKAVTSVIFAAGLGIYLFLSFTTQAWHITWILFLIIGAVQGLTRACIDLKEAYRNEN